MHVRRAPRQAAEPTNGGAQPPAIPPGALSGLFSAPRWLRDLGVMAWLLVGVTALLVGAIWLLSLTNTIVVPVVTAAIIGGAPPAAVPYRSRRGRARLRGAGGV